MGNKLIYEERNYHPAKKLQEFIDEQRYVFKQIMEAVNNKKKRCVFLYGYGRTWKTYILRTLASYIRSKKQFCLTVASSRIASLLLLGGRTTHSTFKIPISTLEYSTCRIDKWGDHVKLLKLSKLIISDETPMYHIFCFKVLDKTLRHIKTGSKSSEKIFGGKVIVFGSDFWQTLPIVPRGTC